MRSGDRCDKCKNGRLRKVKSVPSRDLSHQITTLECSACGHKPPKQWVPASDVRRRKADYLIQ